MQYFIGAHFSLWFLWPFAVSKQKLWTFQRTTDAQYNNFFFLIGQIGQINCQVFGGIFGALSAHIFNHCARLLLDFKLFVIFFYKLQTFSGNFYFDLDYDLDHKEFGI